MALETWEALGVEKPESFLEIFKQRIKDNFMQEWHSCLENSTRARTFIAVALCRPYIYIRVVLITHLSC